MSSTSTFTTSEDTNLTVAAPGALVWESDVFDVSLADYSQPANGSVTTEADGSFVYVPAKDYNGPDSWLIAVVNSGAQGFVTDRVFVHVGECTVV